MGILRVLLTTCPNAARNTGKILKENSNILGGIDLHSEWSSCIQFMYHNKSFFVENNFQSAHFKYDFLKPPAEGIDSSYAEENIPPPDFATMEEFKFENDRHRVLVALVISDFFLYLMSHFKSNHIIQFIYISQLVVDANGVLVLLKFLNQDFAKVDFSTVKID